MTFKEKLKIFLSSPTGLRPRVLLGILLVLAISASLYLYIKIENQSYFADTKDKLLTDYALEKSLIAEQAEETADSASSSKSSSKNSSRPSSSSSDTSGSSTTTSEDGNSTGKSTPDTPTYVAYYADNQSDSDEDDARHLSVVNKILASGANPVFHAGDIMEDGTLDS